MASNPIPKLQDELLALAEDMADGCHNHEVAIGIQHNKEANIRADISALLTTETAFGTVVIRGGQAMSGNGLILVEAPAGDPHVAGALWNDAGTLKASAG
jgi:hypothetical protein